MRGKFLTQQVFTVLRELTATDLKGSLLQLLYESGLCEMEWGTAFFYESSTLNSLAQETSYCQS